MKIVSVGGGVVGLTTAMLLARDGHQVTVLERDAAGPPATPQGAWDDWERRGVNQFRLLHFIQPGYRGIAEREIPELLDDLTEAGALRLNILELVPEELSGGTRPTDAEFTALTGRRPVVEAAVAGRAARTDGIEIRRGAAVAGLVTSTAGTNGTSAPHVTAVRLENGEELEADLILDMGGRRSALPKWLEDIGAKPLHEELEDSGFAYYGRHFKSQDGSTPPIIGPLAMDYGSVSVLTLPADNGTWGCGIITVGGDAQLRGLRDPARWTAAMQTLPLHAHWVDGEPIDDIMYMTKIEDRRRRWVVDGEPVVTGVAPVADAWACTNPSLGRGVSIGAHHAVALRDLLRETDGSDTNPTADPHGFALAWQQRTDDTVGEWYEATLAYDRNRLAQAAALIEGKEFEADDVGWDRFHALGYGAGSDPDLFRAMFAIIGVLRPPSVVFGDPAVAAKVDAIGDSWKDAESLGPTRDEIVAIANA